MKANKKGISLIVLIITIVVIIILAAAIILNLSNTNIIGNAKTAVSANDVAEMQSAVNLTYGDLFATNMLPGGSGVEPTVTEVVEALSSKYSIAVKPTDDTTIKDKKFLVDADKVVTANADYEAAE